MEEDAVEGLLETAPAAVERLFERAAISTVVRLGEEAAAESGDARRDSAIAASFSERCRA